MSFAVSKVNGLSNDLSDEVHAIDTRLIEKAESGEVGTDSWKRLRAERDAKSGLLERSRSLGAQVSDAAVRTSFAPTETLMSSLGKHAISEAFDHIGGGTGRRGTT